MSQSIVCPECLRRSWNKNDVREGYCGYCHMYTGGMVSGNDNG